MCLSSRACMSSLVDLVSLMETRPTSDCSIITDGRDAGTLTEGAGAAIHCARLSTVLCRTHRSLLELRLINARLVEMCE